MYDYTGTRFDFTVTAGLSDRIVLRFSVAERDVALDLTDATWRCSAKGTTNPAEVDGLYVEHGDLGELVLWVPAMAGDEYRYEIFAVAEDGSVRRVLYGVCTAITSEQASKLAQDAGKEVVRVLNVTVPGVSGKPLELQWQASTVATAAANSALHAAEDAERAAGEAQAASSEIQEDLNRFRQLADNVEEMQGRLDGIDRHISQSIVPNAVTNTWWIAGKDTHYPVTGEDGKSPYVGDRGTWMVWDDALHAFVDTWIDPAGKPGKAPMIAANGNWARYDEVADAWVDTGVPAHGRDGVDGLAVRRIVVESVDDIPTEGETCNGGFYYYVPDAESQYNVYAWLETPSGGAGWVCVGLANDLATTEVFGLVKTSTDVTVEGGAPVGVNGNRQLSVPKADYTTPGAVLPSVSATLGSGGAVGFNADGRMLAEAAGYHKLGSVSLSFNGVCEVPCVGLMADGTVGMPWATLYQPGVSKLGSMFNQLNRIPYQQGVGATTDHQLANNLLYGGALQHKKLSAWISHGMEWLEGMPDSPYLNNNDFYMGLVTSDQFSQSESGGLQLVSATTVRLAGVYIASGMGDVRENAVPSAATISGHLSANYYTKSQVYTKGEVNNSLAPFIRRDEVTASLNTMNNYIRNNLYTKEEAAADRRNFLTRTENWEGFSVLTEAQYNALPSVNPKIIYFLV